MFLGFYDNASGNTVAVGNAEVTENEVLIEKASSAIGGGIFIGFAATGTNGLFGNVVTINSSRIISNEADIGGGISVNLVHNAHECSTDSNKLVIENSTFDNNTAFQGSSAYLSQSGKCNQPLLNTTVSSTKFVNGRCSSVLGNRFFLRCFGNLLVEFLQLVTFQCDVIFIGNDRNSFVSALTLYSSSIELSSSAQLQFINNSAYNGAGIHLVGSSSIILNTGSTLLFKHNTASGQGGAIYADTCTLSQTELCFFKHFNSSLHPDDWGVNITFIDNQLATGLANSIYIDTVISFNIWQDFSLFCWKGWSYDGMEVGSCSNQLVSGPAYVNYSGPSNYSISPGDNLASVVQLTLHDVWGNDISDQENIPVEFVTDFAYTDDQQSTLSSDIHVNCTSNYYLNQTSLLYIHPLQFSEVAITMQFICDTPCNICDNPPWPGPSMCDSFNCATNGQHGACPGYMNCRWSTCARGRDGVLCGNCKNGYAIAINDPDLSCIKCNSPYYGVAIFLLLQLVPVLIMLTLLAVLHIKITDGSLSGFVLFSQMVTLQFPGLGYSSWSVPNRNYYDPYYYYLSSLMKSYQRYISIPLTVYSIWNLNFLNLDPVPFCMPLINTAAEAILLQYITAACPLVFIVVTYTWIKCYNNGYRLVVYSTRPVHQLLARFWQRFKIQPSLIDTYAGLILLSFMRFLVTSVKLLKFTFVVKGRSDEYHSEVHNYTVAFYYDANLSYFGWPHAAYGVLAILCLLVFVVTPTIVLLFYHLKSFQRCLTGCKLDRPGLHALVDAYQGCFKNSATDDSERRYYAGISLLFCFCYVAFFIIPSVTDPVGILIFTASVTCFMLLLLIVLRPFRSIVQNITNFLILAFLTGYAFITYYPPIMPVVFFPFLVLCLYLIYRLVKHCCVRIICKKKQERNPGNVQQPNRKKKSNKERAPLIVPVTTVSVNDYTADDLYADRILNPDEYNEH